MAVKNRTEVVSRVNSQIVPTVTNAIHRAFLIDDFVNSAVLRKDVITSATPVGNAVTADFTASDCITITTAVDLDITVSGMENGDVKYIVLTKNATNAVAFTGVADVTPQTTFLDNVLTSVVYEIVNKNGLIYARALTNTLTTSIVADFANDISYKYVTPANFNDITTETGYSVTPEANFSSPVTDDVFKQFSGNEGTADYTNNLQFSIILDNDSLVGSVLNQTICTLPVALHSTTIRWILGIISVGTGGASTVVPIRIDTSGVMTVRATYTYAVGDIIQIHTSIRV